MSTAQSTTRPAHGYPAGTRGLDSKTADRIASSLEGRIDQLVDQGRRFPLRLDERDAVVAELDCVRFFFDGDVLWAELND